MKYLKYKFNVLTGKYPRIMRYVYRIMHWWNGSKPRSIKKLKEPPFIISHQFVTPKEVNFIGCGKSMSTLQ